MSGALSGESSGRDWWHVYRVWRLAKRIGVAAGADLGVVELAALLHDIADWKAAGGDVPAGSRKAAEWLSAIGVDHATVREVSAIVAAVSFRGAGMP